MIRIGDFSIFRDSISTLKETSKDNHDGIDLYMTESTLETVNFDKVKDKYIENMNLCDSPKSNDALFFNPEGKLIFIEFKNGLIDTNKCFDVRGKIFDSVLILTDIIGRGISFTRENMDYILVYNQERNPDNENEDSAKHVQESDSRDAIGKRLMALGGENHIKFGLERFKKYCFKNVFTYNENEFDDNFVKCYTA